MRKFFRSILIIFCLSQASYAGEGHDRQDQTPYSSFARSLREKVVRVGDHLSFLLTSTENPTWRSTLYKASVGLGLSLTGSLIEANQQIDINHAGMATILTDFPQSTCYFFSANLLFNAAGDAMQLIYNHLLSPTPEVIQKTKNNIVKKKGMRLTDEKVRELIAERNKHNQAYIARIGQYSFNSIGMAHGIYLYINMFNSFLKNDVNPFALSFPEEYADCTSSAILCCPVTTPVFLTLYTATLLYNLRELSFCIHPASFVERGDIPFFSFINAFGKIGIAKTMTGRWGGVDTTELEKLALHKKAYEQHINDKFTTSIPKLKEFAESFIKLDANNQLDRNAKEYSRMQMLVKLYENYLETVVRHDNYVAAHKHHLTGLNWFLPLFIRYYANYQLYESALLTVKNLICYFKDFPVIEVLDDQRQASEDNASEVSQPKKKNRKAKKKKRGASTFSAIEEDTNLPSSLLPQTGNESLYNKKSEDYPDPLPKHKIKKRGIPDPDFDKSSEQDKGMQKISQTPIDSKAGLRKEGLDNVRNLRGQYPVKVNAITSAIRDLEKFLNGKSETIQGSEYRLVWHLNGKRYAIKYETPHGWDSSNFAGNKLNRILNVIEIGYLVGLNEGQVNTYIAEHKRYNLLRLGKFIRYLALNPAK